MINNTFNSNTAKIRGGAINCAVSGNIFYTVRLYNFLNNQNESVQIPCTYRISNPFLFVNNTFNYNTVNEVGGALYLDYG